MRHFAIGNRLVGFNISSLVYNTDGDNSSYLLGTLDLVFLASYAISMFFSGHTADRFHLRYYLGVGCILTGISTVAFGLGFFLDIHNYAYYITVQLIAGIFQSTGWPAVVAAMGNWFGKSRRGFFMGLWNAHTSVGNILGSVVAGAFVDEAWGWSFVVPGLFIIVVGLLTMLFLVPYPEEVDLDSPEREDRKHLTDYTFQSSTSEEPSDQPETLEESIGSTDALVNVGTSQPSASTDQPVSLLTAIRVPGVIEYSLSLFFAKFVSYTFLFWLPNYILDAGGFDATAAADLSTVFDLGGIAGGIIAGLLADRTRASATVCVVMLMGAVPAMCAYYVYGVRSVSHCIGLLIPLGLLVNGPYSLITTAVSADLGQHSSLRSNSRALATVTGIIDGTGSAGAALGPLLCGLLKPFGWFAVFGVLILALILAALLLLRRVLKELKICTRSGNQYSPDTPIV